MVMVVSQLSKSSRIAILCGGSKEEHELSLQGGYCMFETLHAKGYSSVAVITLGVDPDRRRDELFAALVDVVDSGDAAIGAASTTLSTRVVPRFDVVVNGLHGAFGEDGVIQGTLEALRIPYTFSGPATGAIGSDKVLSKRYLAGCGIIKPVPGGVLYTSQPLPATLPAGFPLMLKDPVMGCSKGVWKCEDREDLERKLKLCKSPQVLIEQFIVGTDIVCACIEGTDGEVAVWPVVEFDMDPTRFQDLASKNSLWGWAGGDDDGSGAGPSLPLQIIKSCPATKVPQSICEQAQAQALAIFKEMRANGALNVEFRTGPEVDGCKVPLYFIEMSVVPALTDKSVHACCALAGGLEYPDLVERWLQTARLKSLE